MTKFISIMMLGIIFALQSADLPDEPNKPSEKRIDYSVLFRKSGLNDDPTSIHYYLEDNNTQQLQKFIFQAKKDKRFDVLEKALEYAVGKNKLIAELVLLRNEAPISDRIILKTAKFLLEYANMENNKRELYAREFEIYEPVAMHLISWDREKEFQILIKYTMKAKGQSFLNWLLYKAISLESIEYTRKLLDLGAWIEQPLLQDALDTLREIKNHQHNVTQQNDVQTIINRVIATSQR